MEAICLPILVSSVVQLTATVPHYSQKGSQLTSILLSGDDDLKAKLESAAQSFSPEASRAKPHSNLLLTHISQAAHLPSSLTDHYNPYADLPCAWQFSEPLSAFLNRLPPLTTPSSVIRGPFIRVADPNSPRRALDDGNLAKFKETATELLTSLSTKRAEWKAANPRKPKSSMTKQLASTRQEVEKALLKAARDTGVLYGKWMLFPPAEDVNRVWRMVVEGTAAGKLGCAAKVACLLEGEAGDRQRLICIYTYDFGDADDVKRVLQGIVRLGLVNKSGSLGKGPFGHDTWIYYKCGESSPRFPLFNMRTVPTTGSGGSWERFFSSEMKHVSYIEQTKFATLSKSAQCKLHHLKKTLFTDHPSLSAPIPPIYDFPTTPQLPTPICRRQPEKHRR